MSSLGPDEHNISGKGLSKCSIVVMGPVGEVIFRHGSCT